MKVLNKVALISIIVFLLLLAAIFSDQFETEPSDESGSSQETDTISKLLDKQLSSLTNPFEKEYTSSKVDIPVKYIEGYNVEYLSNSRYVKVIKQTKTANVNVPEYGEYLVNVYVSVTLDGITKRKSFEFFIYGESAISFYSYFEGVKGDNSISIRNNVDINIDLSSYSIKIVLNDSDKFVSLKLSGVLASGELLYFSPRSLSSPGKTYYDKLIFDYDGDDIFYLYNKNVLIDVIGKSGLDMSSRSIERKLDRDFRVTEYNPLDWEDVVYKITLLVEGEAPEFILGNYFQNIPPVVKSKEGYTFDGFYTDKAYTNKYLFGYFEERDLEIYGRYIKK